MRSAAFSNSQPQWPSELAEHGGTVMRVLASVIFTAVSGGLLLTVLWHIPTRRCAGPQRCLEAAQSRSHERRHSDRHHRATGGATSVFGSDMSRVLDDNSVRILTVLGMGPVHNVVDVLALKAIDMGVVVADVPEFYRLQYNIPDITSQLRYIAKLYNNEIHVVAPTSVNSIFDLAGKRIVASTDVGYYAAKVIFNRLNMNVTFDYWTDDAAAIQKIVDGQADAYIGSTGKVFGLLRAVKNEDHKLHLVSVPYDRRLQDLYLPTTLSSTDYPNMLAPGETIDTIAASDLLVTFNWPEKTERYHRVANFVNAFFSKFDEFRKPPRHPKWKEASITATIPGWTRFKAAQDWIDHWNAQQANPAKESTLASFKNFMAQQGRPNLSEDELAKLYSQFQEWNRRIRN